MLSRSAWLHLRIPFSYFLLPIYFFSLLVSPNFNGPRLLWVLVILHVFLYPASNGFNSYFDKDEKSIGGLKNPPPISKGLYFLALMFDAIAIVLGWIKINPTFAVMLFVYGLVSKAYSHPWVRLKKYPVAGWGTIGLFQGFFTVLMCFVGVNNFPISVAFSQKVMLAGGLASLMLLGNYPMTQIYQHEEDVKRGDFTLSAKLGIRGTFYFVMACFTLATAAFCWFFAAYFDFALAVDFVLALSPVVLFFLWWMWRCHQNPARANYTNTMWLNFISATCLNIFFVYAFLKTTHLMAVFG